MCTVQRDLEAKETDIELFTQQHTECVRAKCTEMHTVAELRNQICRMEADASETQRNVCVCVIKEDTAGVLEL